MKKLIPLLVLVLALCASAVKAQSDDSPELRRLKLENWIFKMMVKNPSLAKRLGLDLSEHKTLLGFEVRPLTDEERSAVGLAPKVGLKVVSVTSEDAKKAGIEVGDVITRFQSPFGRQVKAEPDKFRAAFLPGDRVDLTLLRGGRRKAVRVVATCSCGSKRCPFQSPLADMGDYLSKARMRANETSAIGTLKCISAGQEQFRCSTSVDQNSNGMGEYGLLGELAGGREYRGGGGSCKDSPFIPSMFSTPDKKGRIRRSGYYFIVYLPGREKSMCDADARIGEGADKQEENYVVYAFPEEPGKSGARVFAISATSATYVIMCLDNAKGVWGGDKIPPPGLAFKHGNDPSIAGAAFVGMGDQGGAAEAWYELGSERKKPKQPKQPKQPKDPKAAEKIKVFEAVWKAAIDEYCVVFKATEDKSKLDVMAFYESHAKNAGFKDWNDICLQAALADSKAYAKTLKKMTEYFSDKLKEIVRESTKKPGDKGK
jgi:hypothetical protein